MKLSKFFTGVVLSTIVIGTSLIVIGQTEYFHILWPNLFPTNAAFNQVLKSTGAALIGSGVFTAITKSKEFTEIFSEVIGEIIWSKKYIEKRKDKKEIWSMVSRLTYDEKFPLISEEIEDIISNYYFPTSHNFYTENYDFILNISDENEFFWTQEEVVTVLLHPVNSKEKLKYRFYSTIHLPLREENIQDLSHCSITSVFVNGEKTNLWSAEHFIEGRQLKLNCEIELKNSDSYTLVINRRKIVSKKSNPYKRVFAPYIIKNAKITVIMKSTMKIDFHKMGTINEFRKGTSYVNGDIRIDHWTYEGLLLPYQGFIIIFN